MLIGGAGFLPVSILRGYTRHGVADRRRVLVVSWKQRFFFGRRARVLPLKGVRAILSGGAFVPKENLSTGDELESFRENAEMLRHITWSRKK